MNPIFVTDHHTIEGGLRLRSETPEVEVVIEQEITTSHGELVGLFLEQAVPPGLEPAEAIKHIRGQGGLVYLEHPYDHYRRSLAQEAIAELADQFDIVEVWNGRSSREQNEKAEDLAVTLGVPGRTHTASRRSVRSGSSWRNSQGRLARLGGLA